LGLLWGFSCVLSSFQWPLQEIEASPDDTNGMTIAERYFDTCSPLLAAGQTSGGTQDMVTLVVRGKRLPSAESLQMGTWNK
jgi:hypothetical protein